MQEVIRFALAGARPRRALLARLPGPDGHLPGLRRPQLRPRRHRHGRRLRRVGGASKHGQPVRGRLGGRPARRARRSARSPTCSIMRQLRRASPLARIVATLGVLIVLQAGAVLRYGSTITFVDVGAAGDRAAPVRHHDLGRPLHPRSASPPCSASALWALYRYTQFGIATTAVAENQRAASAVGLSPDWIATVNWALGSALAGVGGDPDRPDRARCRSATMTNLVLAATGGRAGRRLPVVPDRLRRRHARSASARPS